MTEPGGCHICGAALIPGLSSCVSCGEPSAGIALLRTSSFELPEDLDSAQLIERNDWFRRFTRRVTEARALEYAGDTEGATLIYEELIAPGIAFTFPYRRLSIIYGKAKRIADEERVVRGALANLSDRTNDWFILRLAKILKKHRERKTD